MAKQQPKNDNAKSTAKTKSKPQTIKAPAGKPARAKDADAKQLKPEKTPLKKTASKTKAMGKQPAAAAKAGGSGSGSGGPGSGSGGGGAVRPSHEMIAARAYQVWERTGQPQGRDHANWKQAEAELIAEAKG